MEADFYISLGKLLSEREVYDHKTKWMYRKEEIFFVLKDLFIKHKTAFEIFYILAGAVLGREPSDGFDGTRKI